MKTRILLAVVITVLVLAVGWLYWEHYHRRDLANPLERHASLRESARLDQERRQRADEYEQKVAELFEAANTREEALRQEMEQASAEQKVLLEQQINQLREEMEAYARNLESWRQQMDAPPAPAPEPEAEPEPPVPAPPLPPIPEPEPGDGEAADQDASAEDFQRFLSVAAAGICLAQPEICPAVLAVARILGSLGTIDGGTEVVELLDQVQRGLPVDDETVRRVRQFAEEHPELGKALNEILAGLETSATETVRETAERVSAVFSPVTSLPVADLIIEAIRQDAPCDAVKSFLVRVGDEHRFASREQREAVRRAIEALDDPQLIRRYWQGCLEPLEVR